MYISQVMQKLGANELHDEKINREDPDWRLVYDYFTALLNADELPSLGQIGESSACTFFVCSVIAARFSVLLTGECLQCFDAVGWAAGRASGL